MLKIAFIPIDNRPVCYGMPEQICAFSKDVELFLPPKEFLGSLTKTADTEAISAWLNELEKVDVLVVSLDTIAYGGLIPSRRTKETDNSIKQRLEKFKNILISKKIKTYACSSIMRISNNNANEEEKEYWADYGKKIFDYSFNLHKSQKLKSYDANEKFSCIKNIIPKEILDDYLKTRKRNFEINKTYLEWQKEGIFDYLVFSKDDCAEFGLNVAEAEEITSLINKLKLNAIVKTGADEIPLSLLARAFTNYKAKRTKIHPQFTRPNEINLISKYEDVSVLNSVKGQIELSGAVFEENKDNADIILLVNNFEKEQGELVMGIDTKQFDKSLSLPEKPFIIADIAFANGADNKFVEKLFKTELNLKSFLGYAGWNTTANTLGSAICAGIFKFLSSNIDLEMFKLQQFTRFADDWAYQANCRSKIKELTPTPDTKLIEKLMLPYISTIKNRLSLTNTEVNYGFPWKRFFEIEIIPKH